MDIDGFLALMRKRRSVRKYLPDEVSDEQIYNVIEAARWAPSGANSQPWEIIVFKDRGKIASVAELYLELGELTREKDPTFAPSKREYLRTVPALIVVCADQRLHRLYPRLDPDTPWVIFHHSLGAALQSMHLAAAAQGLGSVWLTVHPHMQQPLRKLFNIPSLHTVASIVPLGYPVKYQEGQRRDVSKMVHHETYDESKMRGPEDFQEYLPPIRAKRPLE